MFQTPEKISSLQFGIMILLFSIGSSVLITPSDLATISKQDAWIACITGVGIGFSLIVLYSRLYRIFPNKTIVDYSQILLGKWLGTFVALNFVIFSFIAGAQVLFYQGDFIVTHILPGTPIEIVNLLFMIPIIMAIRLGVETVGRTAEILMPWVLFLFILLTITLIPQVETNNILPLFGSGTKPIIQGGLSFASIAYLPCIVFAMFIPNLNHVHSLGKSHTLSFLIAGLFMVIITFLCITVLGAEVTARSLYPSYDLAKKINIGNFIQRIEALIAAIWFFTTYFKVLIYFLVAVLGMAQIFRLQNYRPLVFPLGIIFVIYSYNIYPNIAFAAYWDTTIWIPYVMTFGVVLPVVLLVIAKVRKHKSGP